jgi:hypothetical protein
MLSQQPTPSSRAASAARRRAAAAARPRTSTTTAARPRASTTTATTATCSASATQRPDGPIIIIEAPSPFLRSPMPTALERAPSGGFEQSPFSARARDRETGQRGQASRPRASALSFLREVAGARAGRDGAQAGRGDGPAARPGAGRTTTAVTTAGRSVITNRPCSLCKSLWRRSVHRGRAEGGRCWRRGGAAGGGRAWERAEGSRGRRGRWWRASRRGSAPRGARARRAAVCRGGRGGERAAGAPARASGGWGRSCVSVRVPRQRGGQPLVSSLCSWRGAVRRGRRGWPRCSRRTWC